MNGRTLIAMLALGPALSLSSLFSAAAVSTASVSAALASGSLLFSASAQARKANGELELLDYQACRTLVEAGDILPMGELYQRVNEKLDGRMLDTVLVRRPQGYIYQMEIAGRDGVVRIVEIDASTGRLLTE
ncbi:MAG: hypothetical protein OIF57_18750 [Marinobacterium sp.]|nr:hypothetical protein [Marinobacterium sp.]